MLQEHTKLMREFYHGQENSINARYFLKVHSLLGGYISTFEDRDAAASLDQGDLLTPLRMEELTENLFEFFKILFRVDKILDNIDNSDFRTRAESTGNLDMFFGMLLLIDETILMLIVPMLTVLMLTHNNLTPYDPVQVEDDS